MSGSTLTSTMLHLQHILINIIIVSVVCVISSSILLPSHLFGNKNEVLNEGLRQLGLIAIPMAIRGCIMMQVRISILFTLYEGGQEEHSVDTQTKPLCLQDFLD